MKKHPPIDANSLAKGFLTDCYCFRQGGPDGASWAMLWYRGDFCVFDGQTYRRLPTQEVRAILAAYLDSQEVEVTRSRLNNVLEALAGILRVDDTLQPPVWLKNINGADIVLTCRNGNVSGSDRDPDTGACRLLPFTPDYFTLFSATDYDYLPEAGCPRFMDILAQVLAGDTEAIRLVQEYFGYLLVRGQTFQRFMMFQGTDEGANGKGVVTKAAETLVGAGNVSHVPLSAFAARFALYETLFRKLNTTSETVSVINSDAATRLREYTGNDEMSFEAKFRQEQVRRVPDAKLILSANRPPVFRDDTSATFRRMLLIRFPIEIPPDRQDPWLSDKLRQEASGVLNWALEGRDRLLANSGFSLPADHATVLKQYRAEVDPTRDFLSAYYAESNNGDFIPTGKVYRHYRAWCESGGVHPVEERHFGRTLRSVFPGVDRRSKGGRADREYVYFGLVPVGAPCAPCTP